MKARIGALTNRQATLEASLDEELGRPLPDHLRVRTLQRMKLKTKDEIRALLGVLRTIGRPEIRVFPRKKAAA